jgi:Brp/Blh family beta-carotene 15,15'-monooxygenase
MHYLKSGFFKFQILVQVILLAIYFILPEGVKQSFLNICSLILLIFVGIPHGANDLLYRNDKSITGALIFLSIYLSTMVLYAGLWWWQPLWALIIFGLISVHHFGQSNFESDRLFHMPSVLWGVWLLAAPVFIHFSESMSIFAQMVAGEIKVLNRPILWMVVRYGLLAIYVLTAIRKYPELWASVVVQALLLALWYEYTPLLTGFIIVFSVWHSSQSLFYQWKFYQRPKSQATSWKLFVANMVIFTCMAGLILYAISIYYVLDISALFILLSIISLPHIIVMDGLYKTPQKSLI